MSVDDIIGTRYNKLVAISFSHIKEYPRKGRVATTKANYWEFKCDCGNHVTLSLDSVKSGGSMSCGCWRKEASRINNTTHGQASNGKQSRLYQIWAQMKRRCDLPTATAYSDYGGRGIRVCDDWSNSFEEFEQWALANKYQENLTIDRRENDGNYEPENCRWSDRTTQANNRRSNRIVIYNNVEMSVSELSRHTGVVYSLLLSRLDRGWSVEDAVNKEKYHRIN